MSRRVLIFGAAGQVGFELQRSAPSDAIVVAVDVADADIRDRASITRVIEHAKPSIVFNCAAFTNVDGAESARDDAMAINGAAPGAIAEVCASVGARFVHLSTDYVFDGLSHVPYAVDASPAPINVYGESKLEGERRALAASGRSVVVRTAWVHSGIGVNFVKTAVRVLGSGAPMRVVDDQVGTPTRAQHLAQALWRIADRPAISGILHFTDAGVASWYDVAVVVRETLAQRQVVSDAATVEAIPSRERSFVARRPTFSILDKHDSWRAIGFVPPHWRDGVVASTLELLHA